MFNFKSYPSSREHDSLVDMREKLLKASFEVPASCLSGATSRHHLSSVVSEKLDLKTSMRLKTNE